MKYLTIFIAIILSSATLFAQSKLEYKLQPNQQFTFSSSTKSKQTITMMGNENTTSANAQATLSVNIESIDADAITAKVTQGTQTIEVKGAGMMGMADTTMTIDNEGKYELLVFSTNGLIKSQRSEAGKSKNVQTPAARIASQVASSGALTKMIILDFTDAKLEKGASWTKVTNDTNKMGENGEGGTLITSTKMKYSFDGLVDTLGLKCARIAIRSEKLVITGAVMQRGSELSMSGDGVVKGIGYVELATGMMVSSSTKTELDQRLSMTQPMQMEIPMAIDVESTVVRSTSSKAAPAKNTKK